MKDSKPIISISAGPFTILFFIFLTLKLCGVITWSWWWVFAPLIAWPAIVVSILLFWIIAIFIFEILER